MIYVKNISINYSNKKILNNVSFRVIHKDFFGIIGKNGAGKSTLLKILCNITKSYFGNVFINNRNIRSFSNKNFAKIISFLPQYIDTTLSLTTYEFILLGRYVYMNMFKIPSNDDHVVVKKVMNFLNIADFSSKKINVLSIGEKQKVLIAQVMVQDTDIIILDEPTSHLDIGAQNDILKILKYLTEKHNKTIIVSLHDLNAAGEFCNRLILIDNGSICNYGTPEKVLIQKDIEKIYNTTLIVEKNPISNKPYVILINKSNKKS
ncbi:MAG: ABC transporter ATP-binding protein [Endomicrobium sp.]|jgi:iron complex transport system ATP-binding protein|nr:ABC transporter ATP-binding protein [Endomicrobium sp.]